MLRFLGGRDERQRGRGGVGGGRAAAAGRGLLFGERGGGSTKTHQQLQEHARAKHERQDQQTVVCFCERGAAGGVRLIGGVCGGGGVGVDRRRSSEGVAAASMKKKDSHARVVNRHVGGRARAGRGPVRPSLPCAG